MAIRVDEDGNMVKDERVIAKRMRKRDAERAAECCHGEVFEGGYGFGTMRRALKRTKHVKRIRTVEIDQEVIDREDDEQERSGVELGDVKAIIKADSKKTRKQYDSVLLDIEPDTDMSDPEFQKDVKKLLRDAGDRLVVISESDNLQFDGFNLGLVEHLENGSYMLVYDRFEPSAGLGVLNPHGKAYRAGYGWLGTPGEAV